MNIYFNNKKMEVNESINIKEVLIMQEGIEHMAVWLNGNHIMLNEFNTIYLSENDRLNVVRVRGGG